MQRLHLKIYGRVQGIFFRSSTEEKAKELELTGWVKNVNDGTVEVLAEGNQENLKKMLEWCKVGPRLAQVEKIAEDWQDITKKEFSDFMVLYE